LGHIDTPKTPSVLVWVHWVAGPQELRPLLDPLAAGKSCFIKRLTKYLGVDMA
jgi:hypothetical protein